MEQTHWAKEAIAIRKELTHKRLMIRNTVQVVALEVFLESKETNMLYILFSNRSGKHKRHENSPGSDFNTSDAAERL